MDLVDTFWQSLLLGERSLDVETKPLLKVGWPSQMVAYSNTVETPPPVFTVSGDDLPQIICITAEPHLAVKPSGKGVSPPTPGGTSLVSQCSVATLASLSCASDLDGPPVKKEKWWTTSMQVAVPFFLAGVGTIGAGLVLDMVQNWPVFKDVPALFILVPSLLGLKGNLDMCLASRLSTQANLGNMKGYREVWKMILGNLAIVQIQATVAALLVSLFAVSVAAVQEGIFNFNDVLLLSASSVCTATSSCFALDIVMIAVILLSQKLKMNPDNLATPLAASIGDVVSISLLSNISCRFYEIHDSQPWVSSTVVGLYLLMLPIWIYIVFHNKYTKPVLSSGWVPVLSALIISGLGGLVLNQVVNRFNGFVIFQPIINGIGGNLVSVQASRISTMLHQTSLLGIIPPHTKTCVTPWSALIKGLPHARTARILIVLAIVGQTIFVVVADLAAQGGKSNLSIEFTLTYLFVSTLQVILLLYLAHLFIHCMWRWKIDPDNSAIPYLTSIGDLTGSGFLAIAFLFLQAIGKGYES